MKAKSLLYNMNDAIKDDTDGEEKPGNYSEKLPSHNLQSITIDKKKKA